MSACDDVFRRRREVVDTPQGEISMKKIMSLMIGMSLVLGAATFAFGDDASKDKTTKKSDKKKKGKKSETKS
jgi:hypothetical protein